MGLGWLRAAGESFMPVSGASLHFDLYRDAVNPGANPSGNYTGPWRDTDVAVRKRPEGAGGLRWIYGGQVWEIGNGIPRDLVPLRRGPGQASERWIPGRVARGLLNIRTLGEIPVPG